MKLLIFFMTLFITNLNAQDYSKEVLAIVLPNNNLKAPLQTQGCKYQKQKWTQLLLTKQSFKEEIKFNNSCDIEGSFSPKMEEFFNAPLKVKGHKNIKSFNLNIKFSIVFEEKPVFLINLKDSYLMTNKNQKIKFKLNYAYYLDLMSKDPLSNPKGGEFELIEVDGNKVNKKIKIK